MAIYKAPEFYDFDNTLNISVFLGGSIEMGKAVDWQTKAAKLLSKIEDVDILNPRRDDWDSSWVQDPTPGSKFHEQVSWELYCQERANILFYNFVPGTMSPITLLEIGLFAADDDRARMIVCPKDYERYGNVKMVCERYEIPHFEDFDVALLALYEELAIE